eukprot:5105811-Amphidinium_carterae.1
MSCGTPSTIKCGICPKYMCKNCHCYVTSADTWLGFTFACLSYGESPRMVYKKARFARVRAYTPSIHRHDPMFLRNFGSLNKVPMGTEWDERQCWKCSPHKAGDDFALQVENYNINYSEADLCSLAWHGSSSIHQ